MSWDELQHEFRRHEKHSVLIENLSPEIPNLPLNVLSSLYAQLSKFGQPLTRFEFCEKGILSDFRFSLTRESDTKKAEQVFKIQNLKLTFIYSEKATKFCEIST